MADPWSPPHRRGHLREVTGHALARVDAGGGGRLVTELAAVRQELDQVRAAVAGLRAELARLVRIWEKRRAV